jgi:hypothetical protein
MQELFRTLACSLRGRRPSRVCVGIVLALTYRFSPFCFAILVFVISTDVWSLSDTLYEGLLVNEEH